MPNLFHFFNLIRFQYFPNYCVFIEEINYLCNKTEVYATNPL